MVYNQLMSKGFKITITLTVLFFTGLFVSLYIFNSSIHAVPGTWLSSSVSVSGVDNFVNQQRVENGLTPLSRNALLDNAAQLKCDDMVAKDYWSHTSPDGTTPWFWFDKVGYLYKTAGENLALNSYNSKALVGGWMGSPKHRENLLNASFTEVGYGICDFTKIGNKHMGIVVVQELAKPQ